MAVPIFLASFRALGQNASRLADLVESKKNYTYDVRSKYLTDDRQGWRGENTWLFNSEAPYGGGFSQITDNGGNTFVKPDPASDDAEARDESIPGANLAETTAHELLGHVWGAAFGGHAPGTAENKQDSVNAENAVRHTDPTRGQKKDHDHGQISF